MKIRIKAWTGIATWQWNTPSDEVCGICRVSFEGACPDCKFPGDGCPLVWGKCRHVFHLHCITKWMEMDNSKQQCPMDRQVFEIVQEVKEESY